MSRAWDQWGALKVQVKRLAAVIDQRRNRKFLDTHSRRRRTFQIAYARGVWGKDGDSPFFSGVGSYGPAAEFYVERMAGLLERHARELERPLRLVDLGCGDFRIGKALLERLPDLNYLGCDIVPELIAHNVAKYQSERVSFKTLDAVCDPLPEGDVCLVRQVFQHLVERGHRGGVGEYALPRCLCDGSTPDAQAGRRESRQSGGPECQV